jgi:RNA polymerase sigma-70 factor (ECF subfamily)
MSLPAAQHAINPVVPMIAAARSELLGKARALVGATLAEDLVQSTLERALLRSADFAPDSNLQAWLRRIMYNLAVDEWRRSGSHATVPIGDAEFPAEERQPTPAWRELAQSDIRAALSLLPPGFRQVFELYHLSGLSYEETARRLGIPIGTVGTRLLRARQQLREILSKRLVHPLPVRAPRCGPVSNHPARPSDDAAPLVAVA